MIEISTIWERKLRLDSNYHENASAGWQLSEKRFNWNAKATRQRCDSNESTNAINYSRSMSDEPKSISSRRFCVNLSRFSVNYTSRCSVRRSSEKAENSFQIESFMTSMAISA